MSLNEELRMHAIADHLVRMIEHRCHPQPWHLISDSVEKLLIRSSQPWLPRETFMPIVRSNVEQELHHIPLFDEVVPSLRSQPLFRASESEPALRSFSQPIVWARMKPRSKSV